MRSVKKIDKVQLLREIFAGTYKKKNVNVCRRATQKAILYSRLPWRPQRHRHPIEAARRDRHAGPLQVENVAALVTQRLIARTQLIDRFAR